MKKIPIDSAKRQQIAFAPCQNPKNGGCSLIYTLHGLILRFVIANEVKQSRVNKQFTGLLRATPSQ
jgi:hypothetical protein